jgi:hypothetical protein
VQRLNGKGGLGSREQMEEVMGDIALSLWCYADAFDDGEGVGSGDTYGPSRHLVVSCRRRVFMGCIATCRTAKSWRPSRGGGRHGL